jgi:hypothetical protein
METTRKIIRKKIRELLLNKTKACERVYTNQASPTWIENLPAIIIYSLSEDITKFNQAPRELKRDLQVVIEIMASGAEEPNTACHNTAEDCLDDIAEQVECIMSKSETLDGVCDDNILSSIEFDFVPEGQKPVGSARLIYTVTYVEHSPRATCPQDGYGDFELGKVDWDVGHHDDTPDGVIDAQDNIEPEQ